ncbi:MAG: hypothetical protein U9Q68_03955, partial [Euryarchaeota archaeon]|nr:hypothetical protein [Euryarchaeota archaeon]
MGNFCPIKPYHFCSSFTPPFKSVYALDKIIALCKVLLYIPPTWMVKTDKHQKGGRDERNTTGQRIQKPA